MRIIIIWVNGREKRIIFGLCGLLQAFGVNVLQERVNLLNKRQRGLMFISDTLRNLASPR